MIGARLTDPSQEEDPDRRIPVLVTLIMAELSEQVSYPSLAEIREQLGLA